MVANEFAGQVGAVIAFLAEMYLLFFSPKTSRFDKLGQPPFMHVFKSNSVVLIIFLIL